MAWVPIAIAVAGAVVNAVGQKQQLESQQKAALYNAEVKRQEAAAEENRRRRESQAQLGAISAARAKAGITMSGSALTVMQESAELAEIDALNARWQGQTGADLDKMQARSAREAVPYAVGSSLLSGASKAYGMYGG